MSGMRAVRWAGPAQMSRQASSSRSATAIAHQQRRTVTSDPTSKEVIKKEEEAAASETAVGRPRADGEIVPAGTVNGMPAEMHSRPVRIFKPAPPTTQSAQSTSHHWRVDWDILQGGGRWENPLMGWASTADYMQGTHVKFNSKEDAIHFCEKQGWQFYVQEPSEFHYKPKAYADNFLYSPGKLRQVKTKYARNTASDYLGVDDNVTIEQNPFCGAGRHHADSETADLQNRSGIATGALDEQCEIRDRVELHF
ncbi:uncharacterized protein L969DRAFT_609462 [Mixia osmundae IAM 14324]|uniref:NADH dehydrogenase [ubiquinone] iron-sulfur protein 4, mitochondrial n=1 Tax=Mixia osmundae (strain CBS 9802 / IAM 14324 / JCM 22182 / KY 12970) TaxID=764103 RepID=G7DWH2_MIXOS|nr:uncharacterized protein L969DRAFT_609462 [Mixia osmundae IAM 14324]KEI37334.1 hypothetical protein L969DRAFT_609462 [Mixia osmundae IAM 14324]GAA94932.1 hypothetical protein E5Q_01587 [Mixia osmundae IAM 14324]